MKNQDGFLTATVIGVIIAGLVFIGLCGWFATHLQITMPYASENGSVNTTTLWGIVTKSILGF